MTINTREKKTLRQIAHHLASVIIVGDQGVTEGVLTETDRALKDHELIKVRLAIGDRETRTAAGAQIAASCNAEIVQRIGKILILFRSNPRANPKLSNIQRFS